MYNSIHARAFDEVLKSLLDFLHMGVGLRANPPGSYGHMPVPDPTSKDES
jgi:hypothetical protein